MNRICLLTDSAVPSGVGTHLLTLAAGLGPDAVVVAARPKTGLLERAAARGFAVKAVGDDEAELARWLARAGLSLVHVHAGIGWEGHGAVRAAQAADVPVVRTEHLPYLITDDTQRAEHRQTLGKLAKLICVSDAVAQQPSAGGGGPGADGDDPATGLRCAAPSRPRAVLRRGVGVGRPHRWC